MKKLIAVFLLASFSVAVCHAVPYSSGLSPTKTEVAPKKYFELQVAELPRAIDVLAAPVLSHDTDVRLITSEKSEVLPTANSPPFHGR